MEERDVCQSEDSKGCGKKKLGPQKELYLGNLEARRDWGGDGDFIQAMWLMLQQDAPEDYVIATGETHTVCHMVDLAFRHHDLDWKEFVQIDPRYYCTTEVDLLIGDARKARE